MASTSALNRNATMEDILSDNTKKLDRFVGDSIKKTEEITKKIAALQKTLNVLLTNVTVGLPNAATPVVDNTTTEDATTVAVTTALRGWQPPETASSKEDRKSNKSFLNKLSSSILGLNKKVDKDMEENKAGFLWNAKAAKEAQENASWRGGKNTMIGNMVNSIVGGLGQSVLFQSPWIKAAKFLMSPTGIVFMYFIGKLLKKYVWDPYIGPVIQFYNEEIKPVITSILSYFKNEVMPFMESLFPKWAEVKASFKELLDVYKDPKATFGDKVAQSLLTGDVLLAPITNLIKWGFSEYIGLYAKALDFAGMGKAASWTVDLQRQIIDTMHGEFKDTRMKALKESTIGKKYAQEWSPEYAMELNAKVKAGLPLTSGEQILINSDRYKKNWATAGMSLTEVNQKAFENFLKGEARKRYGKNENVWDESKNKDIISSAKISYEKSGLEASKRILAELSQYEINTPEETKKYLKDLLAKNDALSRSTEGQNVVLAEITKLLKDSGQLDKEALNEITNKLGIQAFQTQDNTNMIINNWTTKAALREERSLTRSDQNF